MVPVVIGDAEDLQLMNIEHSLRMHECGAGLRVAAAPGGRMSKPRKQP